MPLREAGEICPTAVFLPERKAEYEQAFARVLELLDRFSPAVERDGLGAAFLDACGLEALFGPAERLARSIGHEVAVKTGLRAKVGIAGGKFPALMAASLADVERPLVVAEGQERQFLKDLPASLLPLSGEMRGRLQLLGLRTMGDIASVPRAALEAQFGKEGLLAHDLACGIDPRPIVPRPVPVVLQEEHAAVAEPLDTAEAILAVASGLLGRLTLELERRGQDCRAMRVCFNLDRGGVWRETLMVKPPTRLQADLVDLLRRRLESLRLSDRVAGIRLTLGDLVAEGGVQEPLLTAGCARDQKRLSAVSRQLRATYGRSPLKRIIPVDPQSRIPERRFTLADFEG